MGDNVPIEEVAQCPSYAAALGYMGVAAAVCLSNWGSAVSEIIMRNETNEEWIFCAFPKKKRSCISHLSFVCIFPRLVHGRVVSPLSTRVLSTPPRS